MMELYTATSYELSALLTSRYSTSFSLSMYLFPKVMRKHIYAIYGLVRLADEIVDTYKQRDADVFLSDLEKTVYESIKIGYSTNPIVHAFAQTVREYDVDHSHIVAFFNSMRVDLNPIIFTRKTYEEYINGSAEVIGLMCLKVFCGSDSHSYTSLSKGAMALGSAYQKVNFLRDIAADYNELGRIYFPGYTFETFDNKAMQETISDIENDFHQAIDSINRLPRSSRRAVKVSYVYYSELLKKLKRTNIERLKVSRVRIPNQKKVWLMAATALKESIRS